MTFKLKLLTTEITFHNNARRKWTSIYRSPSRPSSAESSLTSYVWGCFAIHVDREAYSREVEVCIFCGHLVSLVGPDGISYCDEGGCGIVEGNTVYVLECKL